MGIGALGGSTLTFKRKFRWTLQFTDICGGQSIPEHFVQKASRPNLQIQETQIDFLNARDWIPSKGAWETMTVSYYDVATRDNLPLWNWLASIYNFTNPVTLEMGSHRRDYAGTGILSMYDGCGELIEYWILNSVWPSTINFGDLDMASDEIATIELTLRYSQVKYVPVCPNYQITRCCTGCTGDTGAAFVRA